MRVDKHTRGPTRRNGSNELRDGQHARFNMHVRIEQSWGEIAPVRIDDLCRFTNGVTCIGTHICDATTNNRDVGIRDDLACLYAYPTPPTNYQVRGTPAHSAVDQETKILRLNRITFGHQYLTEDRL